MGKEVVNTSIRVVCRFRPRNNLEIEQDAENVIDVIDDKIASIQHPGQKAYRFDFDHVFDEYCSQADIFKKTAEPMVYEILQGYNSTIFAYGQTGSGKTFTMAGDRDNQGLIPRTVQQLFDGIAGSASNIEFTIKASYLEIYLEKVRDLLDTNRENLRIRESPSGMLVEGATEIYVASPAEVMQVMEFGASNRVIASTRMNLESSRSHSIFIMTVHQLDTITKSKKNSKLLLVDLAGSEKVEKTEASGTALKEAQNINKSLSALGNVINALATNSAHVPYRDSKLTKLLRDSIGGNSLCCLIICCSPSVYNVVETITTCRFGQRAKLIHNKAEINSEKSLAEYKALLAEAEKTIQQQTEIIEMLEKGPTLPGSHIDPEDAVEIGDDVFFEPLPTVTPARLEMQSSQRHSVAAGSAIVELQDQLSKIEKKLVISQDEVEGYRDRLSDKQSEIAIHLQTIENLNLKQQQLKSDHIADQVILKKISDEAATLSSQAVKLQIEVEEQRMRAEKAEMEAQRIEKEQTTRLEGLGTWTKEYEPQPNIDPSLPPKLQIESISRQYAKLFFELTNTVEKLIQLQESYSDLEEELKAHRSYNDKGYLDDDSVRILSKRAFAETQAARLRVENGRLQRIEQGQARLLDSWKQHMTQMEGAVETILKLSRRRQEQNDMITEALKKEVEAYKSMALRKVESHVGAPQLHVHKPLHGGKPQLKHIAQDDNSVKIEDL